MTDLGLYYGRSRGALAWVVPDERYPAMFRVSWREGDNYRRSDMVNLTRAKDAAQVLVQGGETYVDPRRLHWKPFRPPAERAGKAPHSF